MYALEFTQRLMTVTTTTQLHVCTTVCVCVCVSCAQSLVESDNRTVILVKPPAQPWPAPHIFHLTMFSCFASFSPRLLFLLRGDEKEHSFIQDWADFFLHTFFLKPLSFKSSSHCLFSKFVLTVLLLLIWSLFLSAVVHD